MASEQPLKYKMYVHLKNGKVLESKSEEFSESRLNSLDKYLFELGSPNSHTLSLTGENSPHCSCGVDKFWSKKPWYKHRRHCALYYSVVGIKEALDA